MKQPVLVFDDHCPFCSFLAKLIYKWVGDRVIIQSLSEFDCKKYKVEPRLVEGHPLYMDNLKYMERHIYWDHEAVSHTLSHLPLCGWFKWRGLRWFWRLVYWGLKKIRNHSRMNP